MPQHAPQIHPHQQPAMAVGHPPPHAVPAIPDWAVQFQQMSLNGASSTITTVPQATQVHSPQATPQVGTAPSAAYPQDWFSSFSPAQQPALAMPMQNMQPHFQSPEVANNIEFAAEMDRWMASHGPAAESAINAEMEELARELQEQEAAETRNLAATNEPLAVQGPPSQETSSEAEAEKEGEKAAENTGELAAVARRIVEVMDTSDTSDKM